MIFIIIVIMIFGGRETTKKSHRQQSIYLYAMLVAMPLQKKRPQNLRLSVLALFFRFGRANISDCDMLNPNKN